MNYLKESIFVHALRTLCSTFAGAFGILVAFIVIFFFLTFFSSSQITPEKSEMTIEADAEGRRDVLSASSPVILRLDFHGILGDRDLTSAKIESILLDSQEGLLQHERVKAIFMHVNTPGGETTNCDGIYRALLAYKKKYNVPIYAFVDGLCCSGGMYITSAADRVYATPPSVIGSVGIILGPAFNFTDLMGKIGVQSLTLTEGKDKDMLNPFRPWKEGEAQSLRNILSGLYDRFVDIVTQSHPRLAKENLIDDYGAQVYLSNQAQALGYIDVADSDYNTAMRDLAEAAKIPQGTKYQVVKLSPPHSFLSEIAQKSSPLITGKLSHTFDVGQQQPSPDFAGKFLYLYTP